MFTLNLLNDCGWYQVDFTKADQLVWGQNRGCGFTNSACSTTYPEFCSRRNTLSCSADYTSKVACLRSSFSDGCLVNEYQANLNCNVDYSLLSTSPYEVKGAFSRCFNTGSGVSSGSAGCYQAACSGTNSITITLDSNVTLTCQTTGQRVSYGDLTITCPNIANFCARLSNACANDCSGEGRCLTSNTCFCDYLSDGADCSANRTCALDNNTCTAINSVIINSASSDPTNNSGASLLGLAWTSVVVSWILLASF